MRSAGVNRDSSRVSTSFFCGESWGCSTMEVHIGFFCLSLCGWLDLMLAHYSVLAYGGAPTIWMNAKGYR